MVMFLILSIFQENRIERIGVPDTIRINTIYRACSSPRCRKNVHFAHPFLKNSVKFSSLNAGYHVGLTGGCLLFIFVSPPPEPNLFLLRHNCLLPNNTVYCLYVSKKNRQAEASIFMHIAAVQFGTFWYFSQQPIGPL